MMETPMKKYSRVYGPLLVIALFVASVVAAIWMNRYKFPWFNPAGIVAGQERTIFFFVLGLSAVVVIPVFTMLILFAVKYRESNENANYQPEWNHNKWLETAWWVIPIVIVGVVGTVSWKSTHALDPYKKIASSSKTLNVQVVTMEWKWLFIYPDLHIATINQLKAPINTPIHLTLSADSPMSAFWVPSLGSQIYTMNGMSTQLNLEANKMGTFKGYNTNINGKGYAKMDFQVPIVSKSNFDSWGKGAQKSPNVMNEMTYNKLSKPVVFDGTKVYHLQDSTLYDTILMKYMAPMAGTKMNDAPVKSGHDSKTYNNGSTDTTTMNSHSTNSADMSNMKGMK